MTGESVTENEEDDFWEEGYFSETLGPQDIKEKMRTFHMKHDEEMNYNCKKCDRKISAHNKDWHAGLCDDCFDKEVYGRKKQNSTIGIPFYSEADWQVLLQNTKDDFGFKSYNEMRQHHTKVKKDLEEKGCNVVDVPINASEMQQYFDENGLENNSSNRAKYIADEVRELDIKK